MAWTAKFIRFDADSNVVQVEFTDGAQVIPRTLAVPPGLTTLAQAGAWLREEARAIIAKLTSKDIISQAPANTDITPDPDAPPDPDQSTKDQFTAQLSLRRQLQIAVDLGLIAATDTRYLNQIANLKALFDAQSPAVQLKIVKSL